MEYIVIIIISIVILILLAFILNINIKKIKEIGQNKELDKLTNSFPENIDVCEAILKKLGNRKVKIKEEQEAKASLYIVLNDTITIANIRNSYTRIQTIAHECIHSVQSRKMLWFNFIYTNIYMCYFITIAILTVLNIIKSPSIYLTILTIMGMVQYVVRSMLETDAMTKARYVAKEYLEGNNICNKEEIEKIVREYDELNDVGIKLVNYDILAKNIIKIIIYSLIAIIFIKRLQFI